MNTMQLDEFNRRFWLRSALFGSCGALFGLTGPRWHEGVWAQEVSRPSGLTITKVETFPLKHKMQRAMGVSTALSDVRPCLLVKISTDSGLVGWGETIDVGGTRAVIETKHKPALLGKNPLEHRKLWRGLWGPNFGDGRAVGGVDIALHDLRGKALGQSVAEMY